MNKHFISLFLLLASGGQNIEAKADSTKNILEEMHDIIESMNKKMQDLFQKNSILAIEDQENMVKLSVNLPEKFPTDQVTINVKDNRSFKVSIAEKGNFLVIGGFQQGNALVVDSSLQNSSEQTNDNKTEKMTPSAQNVSRNSIQQSIMGRLDFKEIRVEHDEDTNELIVSIPKFADPNTKSFTISVPKKQKSVESNLTK